MARPSKYTEKLAKEICRRLSSGESLRSICRDDKMPVVSTVLLWVVTPGHEFSDQYREAREAAGYAHADQLLEITKEVHGGQLEPQAAKVILDGLKWAAERMAPKAHNPKQQHEVSGPGGGPVAMEVAFIEAESDE